MASNNSSEGSETVPNIKQELNENETVPNIKQELSEDETVPNIKQELSGNETVPNIKQELNGNESETERLQKEADDTTRKLQLELNFWRDRYIYELELFRLDLEEKKAETSKKLVQQILQNINKQIEVVLGHFEPEFRSDSGRIPGQVETSENSTSSSDPYPEGVVLSDFKNESDKAATTSIPEDTPETLNGISPNSSGVGDSAIEEGFANNPLREALDPQPQSQPEQFNANEGAANEQGRTKRGLKRTSNTEHLEAPKKPLLSFASSAIS